MFFLYLLGGIGLLFGFGGCQARQLELKAASDIKSELDGPNARVDIRARAVGLEALSGHVKSVDISASNFETPGLPLFTDPHLSKDGKIDELRIELKDFTLRNLHILELDSSIPHCRFDFQMAVRHARIRLSESGVGCGNVKVGQKDLEAFILRKYRGIKAVHVEMGNGLAHVWGYGEFLVIHTNFDLTARLVPIDGTHLALQDASISFDGRPADAAASRVILQTLNPVVDLDKDLGLQDAMQVSRIELRDGCLFGYGQTKIPERPSGIPN